MLGWVAVGLSAALAASPVIPWSTLAALAPQRLSPAPMVASPLATVGWHPLMPLATTPRSPTFAAETPRLAAPLPFRRSIGPVRSPEGDMVLVIASQLFVSPWAGRASALDPHAFPYAGSRSGPLLPEATIKVGWVME